MKSPQSSEISTFQRGNDNLELGLSCSVKPLVRHQLTGLSSILSALSTLLLSLKARQSLLFWDGMHVVIQQFIGSMYKD